MDKIDEILSALVKEHKTPSVHYICFNDLNIIKQYFTGFADVKNKINIDFKTTYHAFSVTKTFTALAVLQLAEQQRIYLDQPLKVYLPEAYPHAGFSVRQLLTHSAGIPNPFPLRWIHLVSEHDFYRSDRFFGPVFARNDQTIFKPNEKFSYSNLGYVLLGQLIERVSGLPYETYIEKNIIQKLGIDSADLGFTHRDFSRHAKGYQKNFSFLHLILYFLLDEKKYMDPTEGYWKPFKPFYVNGASYGGLIGTPQAFVIYLQELLKSHSSIISDDYKKILFSENHTNKNKPTGMCLSWFHGQLLGTDYYTHAGGGGGYYCEIRLYPAINFGSVLFFNRTGMSDERFLDKLDRFFIPLEKGYHTPGLGISG